MTTFVSLNWWALALRGMVAIIFGLIAFFVPGVTLYALTLIFGAYALIDGVVSLIAAARSAWHGEHWWALLFEGIVGLGAGAAVLIWPLLTLVVLVYLIAAWAVITGIFEIAAAVRLRHHVAGEWLHRSSRSRLRKMHPEACLYLAAGRPEAHGTIGSPLQS